MSATNSRSRASELPLILVATPIGNLGDLSPRAHDALRTADVICCEDTRRTGKLLELVGIERTARFVRVDEHTEVARSVDVLDRLVSGQRVVLVTDAGMPGVSDPGERLVRAALDAGHAVEVVPGPSAVLTALVVSGLATGRFVFEGFLPRKGSARAERLAALAQEARTIILYEAPHRLARTLLDLVASLGGDRQAAAARELTKLHEEVRRGTLAELAAWAGDAEPPGELVLVIEGAPTPADATDDEVRAALLSARAEGLSTKDAATRAAAELSVPRRRAYDLAIYLDPETPDVAE
ncbi:MAG: 16S rRNA (cytidine(1402)-2'-O)-methyltransferase [Acidimicrobiales bacterium]